MGPDEGLSAKSIPVKFWKCERRESSYFLVRLPDENTGRHQVSDNFQLRLSSFTVATEWAPMNHLFTAVAS